MKKSVAFAMLLTLGMAGNVAARHAFPATLSVSPDPVAPYAQFTVSGCGYAASSTVRLVLTAPGGTAFWGAFTDSAGCVSSVGTATPNTGSATLDAFEGDNRKPSGETSFVIG